MGTFWKYIKAHAKTEIAVAGAVAMVLTRAYPQATWLPIVVSLATALGVYQIPNGVMPGKRETNSPPQAK